ncbi:hypothetical protein [Azospirillum canadense]|uniref:hypothetical protein n=1 Tax=Azospirillum canadense TaxID=403962 RepID=UPI00222799E5|nr:hypothetical protein [Azospirillum canadense]MCW2237054.1 hypothetical protein [Azospirillum canadense]
MPAPRLALFVPNLDDHPPQHAMVVLANHLHGRGIAIDVVAPMGGGPLRTALRRGIGQIDLAKRHTRTSVLALARILAERRPAGLLAPGGDAGLVAVAAAMLSHTGTRVVLIGRASDEDGGMRALLSRFLLPRAAARLEGSGDSYDLAERCLGALGLPPSFVAQGVDGVQQ